MRSLSTAFALSVALALTFGTTHPQLHEHDPAKPKGDILIVQKSPAPRTATY